MFGEKAGSQPGFFTKHPEEFAAAGSRKALLRSSAFIQGLFVIQ
jgi:hypothetical protein